jgi:hypothetical protein
MISLRNLGILVVLLVVVGLLAWWTGERRNPTVEGGGFVDVLPGVDAGQISELTAWLGEGSEEDPVELQRSSDGWIVASRWGWKAKQEQVQRLLDDLGDLRGEKRSSSAEVLADYEIDDDAGLHVVAKGDGGSELFHLVIGKTALRGGCFVRRAGSDDVFLASASLRSTFGVWGDEPKPPPSKHWIDLRIWRAERNDVDRVVLRDGDRETVLEKEFAEPAEEGGEIDRTQWTWKPDGAGEFDKGRTDGVVSTLCNLYASDVVEPGDLERYGLGDGARTAEMTFADGTVTVLRFGDATEDEKSVYVAVGEEGDPAQIAKSTADRVFLDRSELKPAEG